MVNYFPNFMSVINLENLKQIYLIYYNFIKDSFAFCLIIYHILYLFQSFVLPDFKAVLGHLFTASNLCLLLQKEQNVKGGEGPSGKQAVGINNGTR